MPADPADVKVAVLNTSHPELDQLASELASRGRLRQYFGRYFPANHGWEGMLSRSAATRSLFAAGPGRRKLPPELETLDRYQAGVLWDFASGVPRRVAGVHGEGLYRYLQHYRDRAIVQTALRHWDADDPIVANFSAGLEVFERAAGRGTLRMLNYPTAHHAYAQKLLAEEAEMHPEFAADLRRQLPDAMLAERLDRECALATRIIVGSSFAKQTFLEGGIAAEKVFVSPYGCMPQDFVSDAQGDNGGTFRAVWAGQVTQRKGIKYLLEAWRSIRGPQMELVIAGHFMAEPGAFKLYEGTYRRAGFLHASGLRGLLAASDVLVLPSLIEGMAVVVLQAMAAGLPVIVTTHGAGDLVRDGVDGFHVPIRDPAAIAEKLLQLRDHPELRAEMGRNARQRAQEFTWRRFRRETADYVESLLS